MPRLSQYCIAIFMATSTATEPESEKNTRLRSAGQQSGKPLRKPQCLLVDESAEHHMRHRRELRFDRLPDMRMVVSVAGRPPARDAVDQFAAIGKNDAGTVRARRPAMAATQFSSGHKAARCAPAPRHTKPGSRAFLPALAQPFDASLPRSC